MLGSSKSEQISCHRYVGGKTLFSYVLHCCIQQHFHPSGSRLRVVYTPEARLSITSYRLGEFRIALPAI